MVNAGLSSQARKSSIDRLKGTGLVSQRRTLAKVVLDLESAKHEEKSAYLAFLQAPPGSAQEAAALARYRLALDRVADLKSEAQYYARRNHRQ